MDENSKSEEQAEAQQNVVDAVVDANEAAPIVQFTSEQQDNATTITNEADAINEKSESKIKAKVRYSQIATVTDAAATKITPTEVATIEVAIAEADVTGAAAEKDQEKLEKYDEEPKELEQDVSIASVIEKRTSLECTSLECTSSERSSSELSSLERVSTEVHDQNREILFGEELDIDGLERYILSVDLTENLLSSEEELEPIVVEETDGLAFPNFLEEIQTDMPEMDSEGEEQEKEKKIKISEEPVVHATGADQGMFVDALSGKKLSGSEEGEL